MSTQKLITSDARDHEILRREALQRSIEDARQGKGGEMSIKGLVHELAERIQSTRKFVDLPKA